MAGLLLLLVVSAWGGVPSGADVYLPIDAANRQSAAALMLTRIGGFGLVRGARPTVPSHLHTGIDIRRPRQNYDNEPIYPIAKGIVISKRTDGPYAQLIVEHDLRGERVWTVYEHIAGIAVGDSSRVDPSSPIARFLNRDELQKYGWQFDHVHLEILRVKPIPIGPDLRNPGRRYNSYTLGCHSVADLNKYFFDPVEFFASSWSRASE